MNRISLLALFVLTCFAVEAQTFSTTTIETSPIGATFFVDGQQYNNAATFTWPTGSKHIVSFLLDPAQPNQPTGVQTTTDGATQYVFGGWADNAGLLIPSTDPVQTITADPRITTLTAKLSVAYRVFVNFFNPGTNTPQNPIICGSPGVNASNQTLPGVVFVGSTCYASSVSTFIAAGSVVKLNAIPFPGFVFTGWLFNSGPLNTYLTSITVNGAISLTPVFAAGKRVHFLTDPVGLNVEVDHGIVPTRSSSDVTTCPFNEFLAVAPQFGVPALCFGDFDFADGSKHVITAPSPQIIQGHWWVFDSFTNGMKANSIYTATNISTPDTLTATFQPGATATFNTNPPGLQLNVDGRQNWPSYNFVWEIGSTHQVAAPSSSFSAGGRQYTFQGWSNGGSAAQTITVDQNAVNNGIRVTANYSVLSRVLVQSVPSGLTVQVDGTGCQTPCTLDRQNGVTMHVTAPTQIPMGTGARLDFASWSDGGASDHTFTVSQDYTTLTLTYNNSYQLAATSNPAGGVSFQLSPASPDMFFPQNTQVTVTAVPNPGFKFLRWGGALAGTYPSGTITMTAPESVVAQMNAIPFIPPSGVINAVGSTPSAAVAPGSIISIYGQGLAPGLAAGTVNPLSQTLNGVTVTVDDLILGLLFVSPQQINAQVPSILSDGQYTLNVQVAGQSPVSATFTVARDAPGLFFNTVNSQQYALALHPDGTAVTTDSPASAGETISVLGTGFGPYGATIVDGFFPPVPAPALTDSLAISIGGQNPAPTWSGAALGFVGISVTNFQVPAGLSSGTSVPLNVTVNGAASNTVMLPIQ